MHCARQQVVCDLRECLFNFIMKEFVSFVPVPYIGLLLNTVFVKNENKKIYIYILRGLTNTDIHLTQRRTSCHYFGLYIKKVGVEIIIPGSLLALGWPVHSS